MILFLAMRVVREIRTFDHVLGSREEGCKFLLIREERGGIRTFDLVFFGHEGREGIRTFDARK